MKVMIIINIVLLIILLLNIYRYKFISTELKAMRKNVQRMDYLFQLSNQWIIRTTNGNKISSNLEDLNVSTIAIYGMGELGERLMEEILINSSLKLLYGMDRNANEMKMVIPIYTLEEACNMEKPDIIVLSTYVDNESLKKEIENKMECKVIMLGDVLNV